MFVTYMRTSYYTLVRVMAFEYDGFAVVLRVEVFFIGDPMLVGTVVAGSIWIDFLFGSYQCHSITV